MQVLPRDAQHVVAPFVVEAKSEVIVPRFFVFQNSEALDYLRSSFAIVVRSEFGRGVHRETQKAAQGLVVHELQAYGVAGLQHHLLSVIVVAALSNEDVSLMAVNRGAVVVVGHQLHEKPVNLSNRGSALLLFRRRDGRGVVHYEGGDQASCRQRGQPIAKNYKVLDALYLYLASDFHLFMPLVPVGLCRLSCSWMEFFLASLFCSCSSEFISWVFISISEFSEVVK